MVDSGAAVVAAAVPGTDQQMFLQNALSERPAAAGTDAVESMDFAVPIAESVFVIAQGDLCGGAGWKGREREDPDKWHHYNRTVFTMMPQSADAAMSHTEWMRVRRSSAPPMMAIATV
jgi:hypothetical protein